VTALFKRDYTTNFDPDAGDTPSQLVAYLVASSWTILALILFLIPVADRRARQGRYQPGIVVAGLVVEVCCWVVWLAAWACIVNVLGWTREGNVVALLVLGVLEWYVFLVFSCLATGSGVSLVLFVLCPFGAADAVE